RSWGIEFSLWGKLIQPRDWPWTLSVNGLHSKSTILAISDALKRFNQENAQMNTGTAPRLQYHENESPTAIYAMRSAGIDPATGKEIFIRPDGTTGRLSDAAEGASVLIFVNDPDCDDCRMARVRLSADVNTRDLIDKGRLTLISLLPDEPNAEWREAAAAYPENWVVGAMEDADTLFDLRYPPVFIYLDSDHKVLAKGLDIDHLLGAFRVANTQKRRNR
ncbi:MAG: hypothetical protein K2K69_01535, partial [Muribaculaceae bacterium]|nr:hypothetical protein [Muribaculaceae bacterium]